MKLNDGDTVTIRKDIANFEEFDDCIILASMKKLAGKSFRLIKLPYYTNRYRLINDPSGCSWTSEMFESSGEYNYSIF